MVVNKNTQNETGINPSKEKESGSGSGSGTAGSVSVSGSGSGSGMNDDEFDDFGNFDFGDDEADIISKFIQ